MKNLLIALLALIVVGGGGWIAYDEFIAEKGAAVTEEENREATQSAPQLSWQMAEAGEDEATGAPLTRVTLIADGKEHQLGIFTGSCMVVDGSSWELVESEVSGVICYFAGGGDEIGVFREGNSFVVKQGVIEEGSAETAGFRGDFKTILQLE